LPKSVIYGVLYLVDTSTPRRLHIPPVYYSLYKLGMVFTLARLTRSVARHPAPFTCRHFSPSATTLVQRSKLDEAFSHEDAFDLLDDDFDGDDTSSAGHLMLIDQRQTLHYLRLIEHEMPKLVGKSCSLFYTLLLTSLPS